VGAIFLCARELSRKINYWICFTGLSGVKDQWGLGRPEAGPEGEEKGFRPPVALRSVFFLFICHEIEPKYSP
jgi:hypothetical protein